MGHSLMATDIQFGKLTFICDDCDDSLSTPERTISRALHYLYEAEWVSRRGRGDDDTWKHYCPDCNQGWRK